MLDRPRRAFHDGAGQRRDQRAARAQGRRRHLRPGPHRGFSATNSPSFSTLSGNEGDRLLHPRRLRDGRRRAGSAAAAGHALRRATGLRALPGEQRLLERRGRLLPLAGQAPADRGRVGEGRPRHGQASLPLGRARTPDGPTHNSSRPGRRSSSTSWSRSTPSRKGPPPTAMLNMAGNVLEWVNDWYRQNCLDFCNPEGESNPTLVRQLTGRDTESATGCPTLRKARPRTKATQRSQTPPRDNPTGPKTGSFKVLRGGSWQDRQDVEMTTTRRFWLDPAQRLPYTGFRCAKGSARPARLTSLPRSLDSVEFPLDSTP